MKWEKCEEKAVVAYFKASFHYLSGGTETNYGHLGKGSRASGQELKPVSPKYEEVPTTEPTRL
jgi:hypothetical protein